MGRRDKQLREFIRENTLRVEQAMRSLDRSLQSLAAEIREEVRAHREESRAYREESRAYFETLRAHDERESRRVDELLDENRAQTQALLRVLDRLDNGGAAPAG